MDTYAHPNQTMIYKYEMFIQTYIAHVIFIIMQNQKGAWVTD